MIRSTDWRRAWRTIRKQMVQSQQGYWHAAGMTNGKAKKAIRGKRLTADEGRLLFARAHDAWGTRRNADRLTWTLAERLEWRREVGADA